MAAPNVDDDYDEYVYDYDDYDADAQLHWRFSHDVPRFSTLGDLRESLSDEQCVAAYEAVSAEFAAAEVEVCGASGEGGGKVPTLAQLCCATVAEHNIEVDMYLPPSLAELYHRLACEKTLQTAQIAQLREELVCVLPSDFQHLDYIRMAVCAKVSNLILLTHGYIGSDETLAQFVTEACEHIEQQQLIHYTIALAHWARGNVLECVAALLASMKGCGRAREDGATHTLSTRFLFDCILRCLLHFGYADVASRLCVAFSKVPDNPHADEYTALSAYVYNACGDSVTATQHWRVLEDEGFSGCVEARIRHFALCGRLRDACDVAQARLGALAGVEDFSDPPNSHPAYHASMLAALRGNRAESKAMWDECEGVRDEWRWNLLCPSKDNSPTPILQPRWRLSLLRPTVLPTTTPPTVRVNSLSNVKLCMGGSDIHVLVGLNEPYTNLVRVDKHAGVVRPASRLNESSANTTYSFGHELWHHTPNFLRGTLLKDGNHTPLTLYNRAGTRVVVYNDDRTCLVVRQHYESVAVLDLSEYVLSEFCKHEATKYEEDADELLATVKHTKRLPQRERMHANEPDTAAVYIKECVQTHNYLVMSVVNTPDSKESPRLAALVILDVSGDEKVFSTPFLEFEALGRPRYNIPAAARYPHTANRCSDYVIVISNSEDIPGIDNVCSTVVSGLTGRVVRVVLGVVLEVMVGSKAYGFRQKEGMIETVYVECDDGVCGDTSTNTTTTTATTTTTTPAAAVDSDAAEWHANARTAFMSESHLAAEKRVVTDSGVPIIRAMHESVTRAREQLCAGVSGWFLEDGAHAIMLPCGERHVLTYTTEFVYITDEEGACVHQFPIKDYTGTPYYPKPLYVHGAQVLIRSSMEVILFDEKSGEVVFQHELPLYVGHGIITPECVFVSTDTSHDDENTIAEIYKFDREGKLLGVLPYVSAASFGFTYDHELNEVYTVDREGVLLALSASVEGGVVVV